MPQLWRHALAYNRLFDPLLRLLQAKNEANVCWSVGGAGDFIRVSFATFTFTLALAATEQKGQQQENMK